METDITKIDPNFKVNEAFGREDVVLKSCLEAPFSIHGVTHDGEGFRRLPRELAESVNQSIAYLSMHTAGGRVRFRTDSPFVALHLVSPALGRMPHFALTGSAGLDLYADGVYRKTIFPPLEGTSQLQTVAAIRHVTTGGYLKQIRAYENMETNPRFNAIRERLVAMTAKYETVVNAAVETKNQEYIDFIARRMVEMAGHIIMTYLLIIDATRDEQFATSAEVYINYAEAEVEKHYAFINNFKMEDVEKYKA